MDVVEEVLLAENDQAEVDIIEEVPWDTDDEEVEQQWAEEREDLSSPLFAAVVAGDLSAVRSLFEQGADKYELTNYGRTLLYHAASNGHLNIIRLLLEQGVDVNYVGGEKAENALEGAVRNDHLHVVMHLVQISRCLTHMVHGLLS